jgi:SAM-dependent methyltransferase
MLSADSGYLAFFTLLALIVLAAAVVVAILWKRGKIPRLSLPGESREGAVEVVVDDSKIKQACADLRVGAAEIWGSWCSRYNQTEIINYFRQEHDALIANPDLVIKRVINPKVVGEALDEFYDLWSRSPAQPRWIIKLNSTLVDAELMYVRYADTRSPVGVMVINEVSDEEAAPDPAMALVFRPETDRWMKHGVNLIERWLRHLIFNDPNSKSLTKDHVLTWDSDVAQVYDSAVRMNPDLPHFFREYVREEQKHLNALVHQCAEAEPTKKLTVVEVGCGTAQALIRCATADLVGRVQYLLGFDSSSGMVNEAEANLREALAEHEWKNEKEMLDRARFTTLDALAMNLHFQNGSLLSPAERSFPGQGLAWQPDRGVDSYAYFDSRKIFCCMLNTLGVFTDETRLVVLENMARALGKGDYIAISVLDGEIFGWAAPALYSQIRDITRASIDEEYYDEKEATFSTTTRPAYWSRWLFNGRSEHVPYEHTIRGLVQALKKNLADEMTLSAEVRPITPSDDDQRVGNFIVIKRES